MTTSVTFNSVRGPLFGNTSSIGFRIFGAQAFVDGSSATLNFFSGFPGAESGVVRFENLPVGPMRATFEAGDIFVSTQDRHDFQTGLSDSYPILGVSAEARDSASTWRTAIGRARYLFRASPSEASSDPVLILQQYALATQYGSLTAGVIGVIDPPYVLNERSRSSDAVVSLGYETQLARSTRAAIEGLATFDGAPAARVAVEHRAVRYVLAGSAYHYDARFPDIYPLFRPRESGAAVAANVRLTETATVDASFNYTTRSVVNRGSSVFGTASYFQSFGSDRPAIFASYSKSDVFIDELSGRVALVVADRYTLGARQWSSLQTTDIRADYVKNEVGSPDRGQIVIDYDRIVGPRTMITASAALQREIRDRGAVGEIAVERSWRGPYRYLVGLRANYVQRDGTRKTADAAIRAGLTRRLTRDGWYGRVEARIPIDVGLPSTGLAQNSFAAEVGRNLSWNSLQGVRSALLPVLTPDAFGAIEGSVTLDGAPFADATILLNGNAAATSDRSGRFRIAHVPVGPALVAIDSSELEPGISSERGLSHQILVTPRITTRSDFLLGRYKTLQVVVLRCTPAGETAVVGARVSLISGDGARTYVTDTLGAFRDDTLPPRVYDLIIDPASLPGVRPENVPRTTVDVTRDVLQFVVKVGCGEPPLEHD